VKNKVVKLTNRSFVRNVIIMASGTAAAQVIALLSSPIITRLYGPEAYGMMGVFQSTVQIIIPVAALTYPVAIVLPKSDQDAKGLMRLSLYISIVLSLLLFLVILFFNESIVKLLNIKAISSYMFLLPVVILFAGLMQINEQWLIRTRQFKITARTEFYRSLFVNGGRISIGLFYPVASVLITLTAIENGIRALMMKLYLRNSTYVMNDKKGNETSLKGLAKQYKDFPIYRSPQVFLEKLQGSIPVLLLTIFFGPIATGFFTISRTVLSVPSQLIGKSIGDVFYPRISEAINKKENTSKLILNATLGLGAVGIIPYGIIVFFGPWIFTFIFGSDWLMAGKYAQWMAFWVFCMFLNRPSTRALPALFAQAFQLRYTVLTLIVRLIAFMVGYILFSNDLVALAFLSISAGFLNLVLIFLTLRISKKFDNENVLD